MVAEDYGSLLFELSGTDRLMILTLLSETPLKMSHISSKLDLTVQETSRNLTRLSEARLIERGVDGLFHLTPYGEESLSLLSGFRFLFKNREYLLKHRLSSLPRQFRAGLSILDDFDSVGDVMVSFHNIENMIDSAEDFVWILSNQVLASTIPHLRNALERGAEFRLIMPNDYQPTSGVRELVNNLVFREATMKGRLDSRFLDSVNVFLCLSENEVAALGFPSLDGKLDYAGFRSSTEPAVEWSRALFTHYWNMSTRQLPEQLINP